jgi:regulator of sirC expression with transglutaminase-like and TPR domain
VSSPLERVRRYREGADRSELDAAVLVAALLGGAPEPARIGASLAALARGVERSVDAVIARLAEAGFAGAEEYYALDNSRIDRVLESRRGIPITLAIVFVEVARRAGLDAHGVGFPGHFLAEIDGVYVDPFANRRLDRAEIAALAGNRTTDRTLERLLERATPDSIALRMINNAKGVLLAGGSDGAVPDVLDLLDCQLALGGDPTALELERAQLWARLRSVEGLREALTAARRTCSDPALLAEIDRRLAALPAGGGRPLH